MKNTFTTAPYARWLLVLFSIFSINFQLSLMPMQSPKQDPSKCIKLKNETNQDMNVTITFCRGNYKSIIAALKLESKSSCSFNIPDQTISSTALFNEKDYKLDPNHTYLIQKKGGQITVKGIEGIEISPHQINVQVQGKT